MASENTMLDPISPFTAGRPPRVALLALLLASSFASACGGSMGDDAASEGAVGVSRDAYVGGTSATVTEWAALVKVNYPNGFCAGTLLSDTWVLTARHCVPGANDANPPSRPGGMTVKNLNGVSRDVAEAFYLNLETDVALLRVSTGFPLDFGQSASPINYLYPYATGGLGRRGEQVRCAGFGKRTAGGSAGTANWAFWNVEDSDDAIELVSPEGVAAADGDSGGPCVKQMGQAKFQFYVHTGAWTPGTAIGTGSAQFRDWALGIMKVGVGLYSESNYKGDAQTIANSSLTLARVGLNAISSVRVPPGWQVRLWDSILPGSGSSSPILTGDVPVMPAGWDNRAQSVEVLRNGVQIYRDNSFGGTTLTLGPGRYDAAALGSLNNNISSLRIPSDWRVKAYAEPGFLGRQLVFYGSQIGSLGTDNDKISSIVVEQAVTVYNDYLYYGHYQILWEGKFDYDDIGLPNDAPTVQSMIVPQDFWVTGWEDPFRDGESETFVSSQPWMPIGWDSRIQSIEVTR